ncbi:hypothetical protein [Deinococcus sp. UYEF24]
MTLDQWLQEATGRFPRGVRERLAQEYGAHLEDSAAAGGSDDVVKLFGKPAIVEKHLSRSYVKQKQLSTLEKQPRWPFWIFSLTVFLPLIMLIFHKPILSSALSLVFIFTAFAFVLYRTRKQPDIRRANLRNSFAYLVATLSMVRDQYSRNPDSLGIKILGVWMLISLCIWISGSFAQDKRLRRTLELEELSLNRRRINLHSDR